MEFLKIFGNILSFISELLYIISGGAVVISAIQIGTDFAVFSFTFMIMFYIISKLTKDGI